MARTASSDGAEAAAWVTIDMKNLLRLRTEEGLSLRPVSLPIAAASPFGKPPYPGRQVGEGGTLLLMLSRLIKGGIRQDA